MLTLQDHSFQMLLRNLSIVAGINLLLLGVPAGGAFAKTVRFSKQDCANIVRHQPAPDVNYKPGDGGFGRKVAPADLGNPSPIKVPDVITFNLTQSLPGLSKATGNLGSAFGEPVIGQISISGNQVYFNGKPLGGIDQSEVIKKCREALSGKR